MTATTVARDALEKALPVESIQAAVSDSDWVPAFAGTTMQRSFSVFLSAFLSILQSFPGCRAAEGKGL
jgi:hypothetical protein